MFDKLIVSEPNGADFKNRRNYFMVSSLIVGVLFAAAVVVSIYAAEIGLGNGSFELVEMIAPVDMAAPEPKTPQPRQPTSSSSPRSSVPVRTDHVANINEPTIVPTSVSTTPNTQPSRPEFEKYDIGKSNSDPVGGGSSMRGPSGPGSDAPGLSTAPVAEIVKDTGPPPPVKRDPPVDKNPPIQSLGVINGKAVNLPKPIYTAAAISVRAQGAVNVQVLIDEKGNVISANAVSGHILLRAPAEQAARNAKFTTTYLSKVPVKVSGVIIYNFTR